MCAEVRVNSAFFSSRTVEYYHVFFRKSSLFPNFFIFFKYSNPLHIFTNTGKTKTVSYYKTLENQIQNYDQEVNAMTILKCSATTCAYNEDMLCSRGEIDVMGDSAKSSEETSCGSFRERNQSAANSAINHCGCQSIQIDCKAHNCTYNENCKCTAAAIDVAGNGAKSCSETKCNTFQCQC